jgi:hypothetical protein
MTVEMQQVEREIGEALGPPVADRLGQVVEMGDAALVGRGDLAVDHEAAAKPGQAVDRRGEAVEAVDPVARQQAQTASPVDEGGDAMAVAEDEVLRDRCLCRYRLSRIRAGRARGRSHRRARRRQAA